MTATALAYHAAFGAALALLSAVVVRLMIAVGVVDHPDARKAHARPTPKCGGVGIVVAFMAGIVVLYEYASFSRLADPYFLGFIAGALLIAIVSLFDDMRDWPFSIKLLAQIAAAAAVLGSGLYVADYRLPVFGVVHLHWLGAAATLAWMLYATNAMNFIDGIDGLAAGVSLIAAAFLGWIAAAYGGWFVYFACLLLAAGLVGFLPFNFPRARIFMGDVGSQFCGFVLATIGVAAARFEDAELSFTLVPMLLSVVLADVGLTLLWRLLRGENPARPHKTHAYQLAYQLGMARRTVTFVYWGYTVASGLCCLLFLRVGGAKPWVVLLPFALELPWFAAIGLLAHRSRIIPTRA